MPRSGFSKQAKGIDYVDSTFLELTIMINVYCVSTLFWVMCGLVCKAVFLSLGFFPPQIKSKTTLSFSVLYLLLLVMMGEEGRKEIALPRSNFRF